jgi:hypothetical protein
MQVAHNPHYRANLAPFWPFKPASWSDTAEGQFYLDNVVHVVENRKYHMVLSALLESTVNLLEGEMPDDPATS